MCSALHREYVATPPIGSLESCDSCAGSLTAIDSLWGLRLLLNQRHLCQFHVNQQTESPLDLKEQRRLLSR